MVRSGSLPCSDILNLQKEKYVSGEDRDTDSDSDKAGNGAFPCSDISKIKFLGTRGDSDSDGGSDSVSDGGSDSDSDGGGDFDEGGSGLLPYAKAAASSALS